MANNKKLQVALTAVFILLFGAVVYLGYQAVQPPQYSGLGDDEPHVKEPREPIVSPRTDGVLDPNSGDVIAGGVERPASDLRASADDPAASANDDDSEGYGTTPPLDLSKPNPQMLSAIEAVRTGKHGERLTTVVPPKPFIPEKFDLESESYDPEYRAAYMNSAEPGRVFATAQPGPGVQQIRRRSDRYQEIKQNEPVALAVWSEPGAPVTFTSFDLGRFENQLTTITVLADDNGLASVEFEAPPGTAHMCQVLAGSPVTHGQVQFTLNIEPSPTQASAGTPEDSVATP